MTTPKWDDDLENLLSTALAEATPPKRRGKHTPGLGRGNEREVFTKPENWYRVGQVQLVHRGSHIDTLLGLFDELRHVSALDVRRLVATHEALPEHKIEYVTADHWLGEDFKTKPEAPEREIALSLPIILEMGQTLAAALPCFVTAHLSHGGISYLTLDAATTFHGRTPREILSLPKGINILEGLTHECRVRVWGAVQIELQGD